MTRIIIAALAWLTFAGAAFAQGKPFTYKGVALGASEAALLKAQPRFDCRDDDAGSKRMCILSPRDKCAQEDYATCYDGVAYGGVMPTKIEVQIVKGVMESFVVVLDARIAREIPALLVTANGKPDAKGATTFIWKRSASMMILETGGDLMIVHAATSRLLQAKAREAEAARKEKAKGL